jgi:hypothetical protein
MTYSLFDTDSLKYVCIRTFLHLYLQAARILAEATDVRDDRCGVFHLETAFKNSN